MAQNMINLPARPADPTIVLPNQPANPPTVDDVLRAKAYCQDVDLSSGGYFLWAGLGTYGETNERPQRNHPTI
jgi:hypothetical protein